MEDQEVEEVLLTEVRRQRHSALAGVLFAVIAVLIGLDLIEDARTGASALHVGTEVAIAAAALAGAVLLWRQFVLARRRARQAENDAARLAGSLRVAREDAGRWRKEAEELLQGLGEAIDRQFQRWGLTAAEAEVALLLLKGLSHKEIAQVRGTSPITVRQQALAVYRKADLNSRSELAAFFLEDLLLPTGEVAPPTQAGDKQG